MFTIKLRPILVAFALGATATAQTTSAPAPITTHFDYRVEPFPDLFNYVREQATRRDRESDAPADYADAIAAAKALHARLNAAARRPLGILAWEPLDQLLLEAQTSAEYQAALQRRIVSDSEKAPGDGLLQAAADEARAFAAALTAVEPHFRAHLWPERERAILRIKAGIDEHFRPKEAACIRYMLDSLGIRDPHDAVPVLLVHDASWPAAFTFNRPGGGAMCTVGVTAPDLAGTLLYETILHEATHALDISAGSGPSVFTELRDALAARGLTRSDPDYRNIPHTIMFIQAGETIRRHVDPDHRHYGDATSYYERSGRVAEVERRIWTACLDGALDRPAAVARIVEELTAPTAP